MDSFNPVTIYFILAETLGVWLWVLIGLGLVLLAGIVAGLARLRRAGRSVGRPLMAALVVGLVATVAFLFAVPGWTLAGFDALTTPLDYLFAVLFAMLPGAAFAALAFFLAASRCAAKAAAR